MHVSYLGVITVFVFSWQYNGGQFCGLEQIRVGLPSSALVGFGSGLAAALVRQQGGRDARFVPLHADRAAGAETRLSARAPHRPNQALRRRAVLLLLDAVPSSARHTNAAALVRQQGGRDARFVPLHADRAAGAETRAGRADDGSPTRMSRNRSAKSGEPFVSGGNYSVCILLAIQWRPILRTRANSCGFCSSCCTYGLAPHSICVL
jgi:hypothetical protein